MTSSVSSPHLPGSVGTLIYYTGTYWLYWAVTQVSLGRCALGRCSLIQAFCPLCAEGMGPFLFCGWCSLSFLLSIHSEVC